MQRPLNAEVRGLASRLHGVAALVGLLATCGTLVTAQPVTWSDPRRPFASRGSLEAEAAAAESVTSASSAPDALREHKRAEAWIIRYRLERGDFAVGDRLVVAVHDEPTLTDTVTVLSGVEIQLGKLPPISLAGVLRVELQDHLTRQLARYLQTPRVTAVPLVRIAVGGEVARPGYYHVSPDRLLSDLVMTAGGPTPTSDVTRSVVRRGSQPLYAERDVRTALDDGMSVDQLHLRSGDELVVGERKRMNWGALIQGGSIVLGLVSMILTLSR